MIKQPGRKLFKPGWNCKSKAYLTFNDTEYTSDTPTTEFPHSLHVDFYDSTQKVQSKLFAKYGLDYTNQHKILLRDSVIIFNITGDTLRCEKLWWDQDKELIYTDVPVHIRKPDESIDGTGLTADQNFSYWTIKNAKGLDKCSR